MSEILTPKEVSVILKVSTKTLEYWRRKRKGGPAWFKLGDGQFSLVRYRKEDVDVFLKNRTKQ